MNRHSRRRPVYSRVGSPRAQPHQGLPSDGRRPSSRSRPLRRAAGATRCASSERMSAPLWSCQISSAHENGRAASTEGAGFGDRADWGMARNSESRPDRFPDGRLPGMTGSTSWWGASAAQDLLSVPGQELAVAVRRAHDNERGGRILAPCASLPHVRHDFSLIRVHSSSPTRRRASIIFADAADRDLHDCARMMSGRCARWVAQRALVAGAAISGYHVPRDCRALNAITEARVVSGPRPACDHLIGTGSGAGDTGALCAGSGRPSRWYSSCRRMAPDRPGRDVINAATSA